MERGEVLKRFVPEEGRAVTITTQDDLEQRRPIRVNRERNDASV